MNLRPLTYPPPLPSGWVSARRLQAQHYFCELAHNPYLRLSLCGRHSIYPETAGQAEERLRDTRPEPYRPRKCSACRQMLQVEPPPGMGAAPSSAQGSGVGAANHSDL